MITPVRFGRGVSWATVLAGPLVMVPVLIGASLQMSLADVVTGIAGGSILLVLSILVGGIVSFVPNLLGATLLAELGCHYDWARHPLVWGATGALLGWTIGLLIYGADGDVSGPALVACIGIACALICRWGTCWYD